MAAMLDALVPYVKQMAKDTVDEELRLLLGVTSGIKKLEDNAEHFEPYMAEAESRRIDDRTAMKVWVSKLKGALYEATDILELCQLHAEERQQLGTDDCWTIIEEKAPGFLQPLLFCLRNPGYAHDLGSRLKRLNASFDEIRKDMVHLRLLDSCPVHSSPSEATPHSHMTTSLLDHSTVVGDVIEFDTKALVQELLADEPQIKVVSIVGAGGMGKTTLAKKIYSHDDIQAKFMMSTIWLSVTDSYDELKLLSSAITQAGGEVDPRGDKHIHTNSLIDALSRTDNFLVVMDDVWSERPWAEVLMEPIKSACRRGRVIITTRNQYLVKGMGRNGVASHQHHVKPLCEQDAWSLLKQQLPQDVDGENVNRLEHIGMGIVRKCDGLPLAIKVVGGLLRKKNVNERDWKSVLDQPLWSADKTTQHELNSALLLSYNDLPTSLKQCFMYYSLFPKGLTMIKNHVVGMWMSEGFIQVVPGDERPPQEIGLDYYNDLIQRNLIEPVREIAGDRSVSKMHDVIRSFAQKMAEEELLVVGPGQNSQLVNSSRRIRRLSVESTELESSSMELPEWSSISEKHKLLRSLIIDGRVKFNPSTTEFTLNCFPSLRALLVRHAKTEMFMETLCSLRHLRFLHLDSTDISRLPEDIGKLRFLQHIGLDKCMKFAGELPTSMLKLERLTSFIDSTKFNVPKGFGGLTSMRTLSLYPVQMDGDWCSLQELGPLSELSRLELRGLAAVPSGELAAKARMRHKEHLIILALHCYDPPEDEISISNINVQEDCRRMEEVFDQLCPPRLLENLVIKDYIGRQLPSWMTTAAAVDFGSLTTLEMGSLPFCTQLPDGLCRLPNLTHLYIDFALSITRVGPEFQQQTKTCSSSSITRLTMQPSFPSLQYLRFKVLPNWAKWEWAEEAEAKDITMPKLRELGIVQCQLSCLPAGLASSRRFALRELVLHDMASLTSLENLPSVEELTVARCPKLWIIRDFANKLRGVRIEYCPALKVLQAGPALEIMYWKDPTVDTLPDYFGGLKLNILWLYCNPKLVELLSSGNYRTEADKHPICKEIRVTPCYAAGGSSASTAS